MPPYQLQCFTSVVTAPISERGSGAAQTKSDSKALLPKQATVLLPAMRFNTCSRLSASWGMRGVMSIALIVRSAVVDSNHADD
jgi:hypothetical protein